MTSYGQSPWVDRFPKSRIPEFPRLRGPLQTDVAIVGAGLTGCVTAYALARAGVKVVLLDADRVGRGHTASAVGLIAEDPGVSYFDAEKAMGRRHTRHVFRSWHRGALDMSALLKRLDVKCHWEERQAITVATAGEQVLWLKREQKFRREAGLEAPFVPGRTIGRELGVDVGGAVRDRTAALVDPFAACLGVAAAAAREGVQVFERSLVGRVKFGRKNVDLFTAGGAVRAGRVVVATGFPTALFKSLRRHFWFQTTYFVLTDRVPSKVRQQLGQRAATIRDLAKPAHLLRWLDDERLMVQGADAASVPDRLRAKTLVQRTGQLMYEASVIYPPISGLPPSYGWDAPYGLTADGLPYIGPHRNFPHHLFAFGDASRTVSGAVVASRILTRHVVGEPDPDDDAFAFTRHGR